jgi:hypothetical protein
LCEYLAQVDAELRQPALGGAGRPTDHAKETRRVRVRHAAQHFELGEFWTAKLAFPEPDQGQRALLEPALVYGLEAALTDLVADDELAALDRELVIRVFRGNGRELRDCDIKSRELRDQSIDFRRRSVRDRSFHRSLGNSDLDLDLDLDRDFQGRLGVGRLDVWDGNLVHDSRWNSWRRLRRLRLR